MRRRIGWTISVLVLLAYGTPASAAPSPFGAPGPAAESAQAIEFDSFIRHPPRPLARRIREALPTVRDLPKGTISGGASLFAAPRCPDVPPTGPIPRAKAARSFFVRPNQVLVTQVLAYRSPTDASEALAAWFQETAVECERYRTDQLFGIDTDGEITAIVTNRPTDAPVRAAQERRAIRTRVSIRIDGLGRQRFTSGVGATYRQGRYLVFVETTGVLNSGPVPRPDLRLLRTTVRAVIERIGELPRS